MTRVLSVNEENRQVIKNSIIIEKKNLYGRLVLVSTIERWKRKQSGRNDQLPITIIFLLNRVARD